MTELQQGAQAGPVVKVARDLSAITDLAVALETEVIHKANDHLMPGGLAMVSVAGVADLDWWAEQIEYAEQHHLTDPKKYPNVDLDEDDDWETPLQTLKFWSTKWRTVHQMTYRQTPTLASEINFLRWALDWAWDNEPHWDAFAGDVNKVRLRLESVLYAGKRVERSRVVCDREDCPTNPRLIKVRTTGAADTDFHKCPACKTKFNPDEFKRAHAKQLRSAGAEKFVHLPDAIGTLKAQGRAEPTIRKWLRPPLEHDTDVCDECGLTWDPNEYPACPAENEDNEPCGGILTPRYSGDRNAVVESYCEVATHKVWVWWPDLWRLHCATQTRRRKTAA